MTPATSTPAIAQPSPFLRGLATVAFLKASYDEGRDHIANFLPIVLDAAQSRTDEDFGLEELQVEIRDTFGLLIPATTLRTLLSRATHKGALRREGGRYFRRKHNLLEIDVQGQQERLRTDHAQIASAFRSFVKSDSLRPNTDEAALELLVGFLEQNHVAILLDERDSGGLVGREQAPLTEKQVRLVARFIKEEVQSSPELLAVFETLLEGYVLQNALFLNDISAASRKFSNLRVFLDTGLLISLLGFRGEREAKVAREALVLVKESGATAATFEPTVRELRRILTIYRERLGTAEGVRSLRPTAVTRFFLTRKYTPSDVVQAMALLEKNLADLGVRVAPLPPHDRRYTFPEERLANTLSGEDQGPEHSRVQHDVECIAGVLTLRRGNTSQSLDHVGAVFVTSSSLTVRNAQLWFAECDGVGIPPILHQYALSNAAWIKAPAKTAGLKVHELIVLCSAMSRPGRKLWDKFLGHLRQLREQEVISSDEEVAILASNLTDQLLAVTVEDEDDPDAETLTEVVERVKADYRASADTKIEAVERAKATTDEELRQMRLHTIGLAASLSRAVSWSVFGLVLLVTTIGLWFTILGIVQQQGASRILPVAGTIVVAVITLLNFGLGFNLRGWRSKLDRRLCQRMEQWLTPRVDSHPQK